MSFRDSLRNGLFCGGKKVSVRDMGGQSSIAKSTANLIKNLVGTGILTLPARVASFADTPSAVVHASCLLVIVGIVFGYFFQLIAKTCSFTYSVTFRETWEDTMGSYGTNSFVGRHAEASIGKSRLFHDSCGYIPVVVPHCRCYQDEDNIAAIDYVPRRTSPVLDEKLGCIGSILVLGTGCIILIAFCMTARYLDGSYNAALNGRFLNDLDTEYQPSFGDYSGAWTSAVLIFAALSFEAYVAHYNAPRFMAELKEANLYRFCMVVGNAFGISTLIYVWIMAMGF